MYSCGSLAPKMGRGKRAGGCMDHQFKRPAEPWELTDGYVLYGIINTLYIEYSFYLFQAHLVVTV